MRYSVLDTRETDCVYVFASICVCLYTFRTNIFRRFCCYWFSFCFLFLPTHTTFNFCYFHILNPHIFIKRSHIHTAIHKMKQTATPTKNKVIFCFCFSASSSFCFWRSDQSFGVRVWCVFLCVWWRLFEFLVYLLSRHLPPSPLLPLHTIVLSQSSSASLGIPLLLKT